MKFFFMKSILTPNFTVHSMSALLKSEIESDGNKCQVFDYVLAL